MGIKQQYDHNEELKPIVEKYITELMKNLSEQGLGVPENSPNESIDKNVIGGEDISVFQTDKSSDHGSRSKMSNVLVPGSDKATLDDKVQEIFDLRDLIRSAYLYINQTPKNDVDKMKVSAMTKWFTAQNIISLPNINSKNLLSILDNGPVLLSGDDSIKEDAIELFAIENRYPSMVIALLEYLVFDHFKKQFPDTKFTFNYKFDESRVSIMGTSTDIIQRDMVLDVKYRKKALNTLRDDISTSIEKLSRLEAGSLNHPLFVMIIFTEENSDSIEKLEYRFNRQIEHLSSTSASQIRLICINIKNLHLLNSEVDKLKLSVEKGVISTTRIQLTSQPISPEHKTIDDHTYYEVFDSSQFDYDIEIVPKNVFTHWRVGLRFSSSLNFPVKENRHAKNYPLFHVEKNVDSKALQFSYYDETGKQFSYGLTKLHDYKDTPFSFQVTQSQNQISIDILDAKGNSILDRTHVVENHQWFMISAWADGRNSYGFDAIIKEKKKLSDRNRGNLVEKKQSNKLCIIVRDGHGNYIHNASVVVMNENTTIHSGTTNENGLVEFLDLVSDNVTILVAHADFLSIVLDKFDVKHDVELMLKSEKDAGSIIIPSGTGYIPGLEGRLNPILDSSYRTYFYADNIAIDGGKQQPVHFEIDKPIFVEDNVGIKKRIYFRFIKGRTSVIDYYSA